MNSEISTEPLGRLLTRAVLLRGKENRLYVTFKQVLGDVLGDSRLEFLQQIKIALPHFGRDLETNVQKLPETGIELSVAGVMPECGRKLLGSPFVYRRRIWQFLRVNSDDSRIGSA